MLSYYFVFYYNSQLLPEREYKQLLQTNLCVR